jgi:hypothetical protein
MMSRANSQWRIVLALLAIMIVAVGCRGADSDRGAQGAKGADGTKSLDDGKEKSNPMENLYSAIFGGPGRSSFIDAASSGQGEIAWEAPLNDKAHPPFTPVAILVSDRQLFVCSESTVASFGQDGKRLWLREMRPESPVGLAKDIVYFRTPDALDRLAAVTFAGQAIDRENIILESDLSCRPIYIFPLDRSFLAVSLCVGPPEGQPPAFIPYRKEYEKESFLWSDNLNGTPPLAPLYVPARDRMIVFAPEEIVVYNAAKTDWQADVTGRFKYPFDKIIQAAVDKSGNLYLLGSDAGNLSLVAVDLAGAELWRWTGASVDGYPKTGQPPIVAPGGVIHIPYGRKLIAVKDGQEIRAFAIEKQLVSYATALADGSVLIAADDALFFVKADGSMVYGLSFDTKIMTPPVADIGGAVYIATAEKLIKII